MQRALVAAVLLACATGCRRPGGAHPGGSHQHGRSASILHRVVAGGACAGGEVSQRSLPSLPSGRISVAAAAAEGSRRRIPRAAPLVPQSRRGDCLGLRGGGSEGYGTTDPVSQFGKNGHIDQIEYALKAVQKGLTVIVLKGEHTICILVERRGLPKLQEASSARKIHQIDAHIIGTMAGLTADARVLVDRAQVECLNHRLEYEDCPSVSYVARFLGDVALSYTMRGDARPFGVSMILSGFDLLSKDPDPDAPPPKPYPVPRIFLVEPSGMYQEWKAVVIGRNSPSLMQYLEKNYHTNIEKCEGFSLEAEERFLAELALSAMMEVSKVTSSGVEMATQTADGGCRILHELEVQVFLDNLEAQAEADRDAAIEAGLLNRDEGGGVFDLPQEISEEAEDSYGIHSSE